MRLRRDIGGAAAGGKDRRCLVLLQVVNGFLHHAPAAWELLAHMPATEPAPLAILEGKAAQYGQARRLRQSDLGR